MTRLVLSLIVLLAAPALAHAEAPDRYGPARGGLRPSEAVLSGDALLTWASKQRAQRQTPAAAPPPLRGAGPRRSAQSAPDQAVATPQPAEPQRLAAQSSPPSIYENTPPRQARIGLPYAPQRSALQARRYSVGREFGVEPDRIAIPDPSILAYAPEVGAAVLAQQERDKGADPGPASPADLDLMEQRQQDAERAEARQKTQAENRAKKAR